MSLNELTSLNELFFKAWKNIQSSANRVVGDPYRRGAEQFYAEQRGDFHFVTYKEVVVASILWTKELFGSIKVHDIHVKDLEMGDAKEWFNVQLIQTNPGLIIAGEQYNPYVNIQFSYNNPDEVTFDIGFYRYACNNGLLRDRQGLSSNTINSRNLYEIPTWLNKCLLKAEANKLEKQIKVLRSTKIEEVQLRRYLSPILRRWGASENLIDDYIQKMDSNAYALINILTDAASNNNRKNREDLFAADTRMERRPLFRVFDSYYSEQARRQKLVGLFLEKLIDEIMEQNGYASLPEVINNDNFRLTDEDIDRLSNTGGNNNNMPFDLRPSRAIRILR